MSKKKVSIIDCQLGNLFSVKHACDNVGLDSMITSQPEEIERSDGLILPGVGAFGEAMNNLDNLGLTESILKQHEKGIPLFGICLGLQLLFTKSEEFGERNGLGLIEGTVKKFEFTTKKVKVPQIGWNKAIPVKSWEGTPMATIRKEEYMYFVHSFYVEPANTEDTLCETVYENKTYCSAVYKNSSIFATQFHPEKSGESGIEIYRSWAIQNDLI